jgi:glutathione peroxidase-family protein
MTFYPAQSVASQDYGVPFDYVFDNTGSGNQPLYEGSAYPGTATTAGVIRWRIRKFFFDVNGNISGWRWADGSTEFKFDWSARTGYTYAAF